MDPEQAPEQTKPDSERDRQLSNVVLLVIFLLICGGGVWLANALVDARKADECLSSGRRNCAPIETPVRQP